MSASAGRAEDQPAPQQPVTPPDLKVIAETEKQIAELQKATAEAQKATVEALFPAAKLGPQEGKTEVEGKFGYTAQLIAYQVLKGEAKKIGGEIDSKVDGKDRILIVPDLDVATDDLPLLHWEALVSQLKESIGEQLKSNKLIIDSVIPPKEAPEEAIPIAAAPWVISAMIGLADVIGYFKTDYKVVGLDFTLNDHAILANVVSSITKVPGIHLQVSPDREIPCLRPVQGVVNHESNALGKPGNTEIDCRQENGR